MEEQKQTTKESIFRKKALDRISSPEQLDQALTVTGPGVWLPLLAVVVLLIGAVIWMIFGQIDVTMKVVVESSDNAIVCYVPNDFKESAIHSGSVTIAGNKYTLSDVGYATELVTEEMNINVRRAGSLEMGALVAPLSVDASLGQGVYTGEITVQTVHPISYIIN